MTLADSFSKKQLGKYWAEFSGTAVLVALIKLCFGRMEVDFDGTRNLPAALGVGLGLVAIVYAWGYVSGAHFNPSVTTAFMIVSPKSFPRSNVVQVVMYFVMQYLGGMAGGFLTTLVATETIAEIYPKPDEDLDLYKPFFGELVFTYLLCIVILHVAVNQPGNQFYGLAIGFSLFIGLIAIGGISGCCLNSAVWLGCYLSAISVGSVSSRGVWIYWTAPFLGGALAGTVFLILFKQDPLEVEQSKDMDNIETVGLTRIKDEDSEE